MLWNTAFRPNVTTGHEKSADLYIPSGSRFNDVMDILEEKGFDIKQINPGMACHPEKLSGNNINPGRYRLTDGMSNNELVNIFCGQGTRYRQSGFYQCSFRIEDIASVVSRQIEADSADIADLAGEQRIPWNPLVLTKAGIPALFIPNTYEFYWNTSAEQFYIA
jgi:UPF0755 protein